MQDRRVRPSRDEQQCADDRQQGPHTRERGGAANQAERSRKERSPPGPAANAAAAKLVQSRDATTCMVESTTASTDSTVIDLSVYERAAQKRTLQ